MWYYVIKRLYTIKGKKVISNSLRKKEKNSKDAETQVEEEAKADEIQEVVMSAASP